MGSDTPGYFIVGTVNIVAARANNGNERVVESFMEKMANPLSCSLFHLALSYKAKFALTVGNILPTLERKRGMPIKSYLNNRRAVELLLDRFNVGHSQH